MATPLAPQDVLSALIGKITSAAGEAGKEIWEGMDAMDRSALAVSPIPVVGAIAGIANDARNYATGRQPVTPANLAMSAASLVPFGQIAGAASAGVKNIVRAATQKQKNDYMEALLETGVEDWVQLTPKQITALERKTGAFIGPDGEILQYIHTPGLKVSADAAEKGTVGVNFKEDNFGYVPSALDDVVADLQTVPQFMLSRNSSGVYFPDRHAIGVAAKQTPDEAKHTLRHELTHAAQAKDKIQNGANPELFARHHQVINEINGVSTKLTQPQLNASYNAYRRQAGEMQAEAAAWHSGGADALMKQGYGIDEVQPFTESLEQFAREAYEASISPAPSLDRNVAYQLFAAINKTGD